MYFKKSIIYLLLFIIIFNLNDIINKKSIKNNLFSRFLFNNVTENDKVINEPNNKINYTDKSKKNIITYMPRKLSNHSSKLLFFLKPNLPKNWKIIELGNNMTTEEVYQWLSKSKIFLSFSDMEGLGLPPIEAAISGNKVIGYTGEGGREYWKKPIFQEIPKGNIILFTKTILKNLEIVNNNWLKKSKNLRDAISEQYSHDKQLSFLNFILKKIYNIYK